MRIETARLRIRPWEARDMDDFLAMNADPEVMRFFPSTLSRDEAKDFLDRIAAMADEGLGFLAVEEKAGGDLVGLVGMAQAPDAMPCAPAVEIGWRLNRRHWGKGYASEAARAWLAYGFDTLGLPEIVAFTYVGNEPSRKVMERLGMRRDPADDFENPGIPEGHFLRPHVLYRLAAADFSREAARG